MTTGHFKRPPSGPKIGEEKTIDQLDPEHQAELGDLGSINATRQDIAEEDIPALARGDAAGAVDTDELADQLDALHDVLSAEKKEEDPEELAARPDEDDKAAFLRSILGNAAYTREYKLFGGMVVVEMRDLLPAEEDRIYAQLAMDQAAERIKTQEDWDIMLQRYRAMFGIEVLMQSGSPPMTDTKTAYATLNNEPTDLYEAANKYLRDNFSNSTVYRAVMRVVRIFRRHLDQLFEGALNSDFWTVDGSASQSEPTSREPSTTPSRQESEPGR